MSTEKSTTDQRRRVRSTVRRFFPGAALFALGAVVVAASNWTVKVTSFEPRWIVLFPVMAGLYFVGLGFAAICREFD